MKGEEVFYGDNAPVFCNCESCISISWCHYQINGPKLGLQWEAGESTGNTIIRRGQPCQCSKQAWSEMTSEEYFGEEWNPVNWTSHSKARLQKQKLVKQCHRTLLLSRHSLYQQVCRNSKHTWKRLCKCWVQEQRRLKDLKMWNIMDSEQKLIHSPWRAKC